LNTKQFQNFYQAWILYRSETIRRLKEANSPLLETSQSELSKKIAEQWKNETPEMKKWFERDAEIKKLEHARLHPGENIFFDLY
jgi:hypothetical protein